MRDFVLNAFARSADGGLDTDKTTHTHDVKWRRNLAAADNEATRPAARLNDPQLLTDLTQNRFAAFAVVSSFFPQKQQKHVVGLHRGRLGISVLVSFIGVDVLFGIVS